MILGIGQPHVTFTISCLIWLFIHYVCIFQNKICQFLTVSYLFISIRGASQDSYILCTKIWSDILRLISWRVQVSDFVFVSINIDLWILVTRLFLWSNVNVTYVTLRTVLRIIEKKLSMGKWKLHFIHTFLVA